MSPTALCMGYSVKPRQRPGDPADQLFGTASLFLDDTYVKLARAADVAAPRLGSRLVLSGLRAFIHETSSPGGARFVLGFGPLDLPTAERVRWQLAEQGQAPQVAEGQDYVGEPLALP